MAGAKIKAKNSPFASSPIQNVTIAVGAEVSNASTVTITVKDAKNKALVKSVALDVYLATTSSGIILAAAPGSGVAGVTGNVQPLIAGRSFKMITTAAGVVSFTATDSGTYSAYVVVVMPDGTLAVSSTPITLA